MTSLLPFYLLLLWATKSDGQTTVTGNTITEASPCTPLTVDAIFCENTGYYAEAVTYLPNARGHETLQMAAAELNDFIGLVNSNCSNAISFFLCAFYVPACFEVPSPGSNVLFKPCRNLCEYVQSRCESVLVSNGYDWPPYFNCSLDTFAETPTCFGPPDPSILDPSGTTQATDPISSTSEPSTTAVTGTVTTVSPTSGAVMTQASLLPVSLSLVLSILMVFKFQH
ncbi:secreted frizzled-related protein 1-like [Halichondria panicea]|uniref:secreted frizzled-related protein 1-like n=1 Tax=Halichondria panicea TaxID=6063 RepID=UPI00312B7EB6